MHMVGVQVRACVADAWVCHARTYAWLVCVWVAWVAGRSLFLFGCVCVCDVCVCMGGVASVSLVYERMHVDCIAKHAQRKNQRVGVACRVTAVL